MHVPVNSKFSEESHKEDLGMHSFCRSSGLHRVFVLAACIACIIMLGFARSGSRFFWKNGHALERSVAEMT